MSQESREASPSFAAALWKDASATEPWGDIVRRLLQLRGPLTLAVLYAAISAHPKTAGHDEGNWHAKIRQVLEMNYGAQYVRVDRGIWDLASRYSADQNACFEEKRRTLYPRRK